MIVIYFFMDVPQYDLEKTKHQGYAKVTCTFQYDFDSLDTGKIFTVRVKQANL